MTELPNAYPVIRPLIRQGDIFAFGGKGFVSGTIKFLTRSAVSHVAPVARIEEDGRILLIESTTLNGKKGVQRNYASERCAGYEGEVWLWRLSDEERARIDWNLYYEYLDSCADQHLPYDYWQCVRMAIAPLTHVPGLKWLKNHENLNKVYCSEENAAALKYSHGLPFGTNCSDVAPQDLGEFGIYSDCIQIKGKPKTIRNFNTRKLVWTVGATA